MIYSDLTCRFFQGQTFYVNNSSDITFRRCTFQYCAIPIAVKRTSHRLLVEQCRFLDDCHRWGFLPKGGDDVNYSDHIENGAVYIHSPYEGRGLVFRDNEIDGLFDGVHLAPTGPPPQVRTHETDFYRNRINNVCDDLIEADGQCRNLRIFGNRMENFLSGISIAQGVGGPTYVIRNVMLGAGNTSATRLPPHFEGYPVKTNGGLGHGSTGWVFFYHNTCATRTPNTAAFRVQEAEWHRLVFANNIWQGTRDGFVFWNEWISPIEIQNDLIHAETGSLLKVGKRPFTTHKEAMDRLPFFEGAVVASPGFADLEAGDVQLRSGSHAIDAGVLLPGINDRSFRGKAPDIGALERVGSPK